MQRKIFFKGGNIHEHAVVIGNHGNVHLVIDGNFSIRGLVYCPKYEVKVSIKGHGEIELHGVCKKIEIRQVTGDCLIDFSDLRCGDLYCKGLYGKSVLNVRAVQLVSEWVIGDQAIINKVKPGALQSVV
jgi:hypothetical protein